MTAIIDSRTPDPKKFIKGATGDWEVVIGMEVHAQVASRSKLFSGASTGFGAEPNSHVSLVDAAMPGMLPVINGECVKQAVRTGLGLEAQINLRSVFDRKNYFYADLPQGYQISQYKQPVVGEGSVHVDVDGRAVEVGIERLHLEQDAGKSVHDRHPTMSFVDLNRSGIALMEIVSRPDLRSAEDAKAYVVRQPGSEELTIDHVLPRSRGGTSTGENCVLACVACNKRKADRTPAEAHMPLRKTPVRPSWQPLYARHAVRIESWSRFLSETYWTIELEG